MKFNTQICTTREQSEHLLALGLKKETADTFIWGCNGEDYMALNSPDAAINEKQGDIYAWSLHRLIAMINDDVEFDDFKDRAYDDVIKQIEATIKQGRFDKEYLEDHP